MLTAAGQACTEIIKIAWGFIQGEGPVFIRRSRQVSRCLTSLPWRVAVFFFFFSKTHSRSIKPDTLIKYASSLTGIDLAVNMRPHLYARLELLNFISCPLSESDSKFCNKHNKIWKCKMKHNKNTLQFAFKQVTDNNIFGNKLENISVHTCQNIQPEYVWQGVLEQG